MMRQALMDYIRACAEYRRTDAIQLWKNKLEPYLHGEAWRHETDVVSYVLSLIEAFNAFMILTHKNRSPQYWDWKYSNESREWSLIMKYPPCLL